MKNLLIIEDFDTHMDHFEYTDNADIFDTATKVPVYGQVYGYARDIGQAAGNLFGIGKEDKSDVGFKQFLSSGGGSMVFYPTKDEMIQAAQQGGWEKVEPPAISASYNPTDGTWKRGDWNFKVISTTPIVAKAFKGAKESGTLSSKVNAKVPVSVSPQNATVAIPQSAPPTTGTSMTPTVAGMPDAIKAGTNQPTSSTTPPKVNTNEAPVQVVTDAQGRKSVVKKKVSGAAALGDEVKGLMPSGTQTYIIMGVFLVIILVVLFVGLKK